jgi:hypothetical protein
MILTNEEIDMIRRHTDGFTVEHRIEWLLDTLAEKEKRIRVQDQIIQQQNAERAKIFAEAKRNDEQQGERIRVLEAQVATFQVESLKDAQRIAVISARIDRTTGLAEAMPHEFCVTCGRDLSNPSGLGCCNFRPKCRKCELLAAIGDEKGQK